MANELINIELLKLNNDKVKTWVENKIKEVGHLTIKKVEVLPETDIDPLCIYFVPAKKAGTYDEYMYIDDKWELIGSSDVDLEDYYKKSETDDAIDTAIGEHNESELSHSDIRELIQDNADAVGDLSTLKTTAKDSAVDAVNSVYDKQTKSITMSEDGVNMVFTKNDDTTVEFPLRSVIDETELLGLADVDADEIEDGQYLKYDAESKKFVPETVDNESQYNASKAYTDERLEEVALPTPESKDKLLVSTENEETSELEWSQVDKTEIVEIDDEMSETSENPVQNKVVNKAIIDNVFPKVENPSAYFSSNTGLTGCFIYTGEDKEWVYNNMGSSSTQSRQSTVNLIKNNLYCISERKTIGTSSGSQLHCYNVLNMSSNSDNLKTMYDYGTIKDKYNFKNCSSVVELYNSIGGCLISVQNISDVFPETNGVIILAYANSYKATIYSTPVYTINMWFISTTGKMYICNDDSSTVSWNDSPYYIKPTEGISKTDLASDIQTSLGKADTSLQSETSLSKGTTSGSGNAVTDISVSGHKITLTKGSTFLTSHQDISGKVDKVSGKGLSTNDFTNTDKASITYYGVCDTSRATNAKVVACTNFSLKTGIRIVVKFTDTEGSAPTSGNITLNVNSTGGKNIVNKNGTQMTYSNSGEFRNNRYCEFVYDGTNFVWLNYDSNTTYTTITQSEITAGTSTSTRVVTPKLLADNYLNKAGGTMTGALSAQKGLRVPTSAPSSPQDGDIWIG